MNGAHPDQAASADARGLSRNLLLRIAAAAVLIPLAIGAAWAGGWIWLGVVTLVAGGLYVEWLTVVEARRPLVAAAGLTTMVGAAISFGIGRIGTMSMLCAVCIALAALLSPHRRGWAALGGLYALMALVSSVLLRRDEAFGFSALMFVLVVVWVTDIGGYVAGRGLGGPRLWPKVSPKKTWAGAVGGCLASLAVAVGFSFAGAGRMLPLLLLAAGLTIASQLGDLFESAVKRRFGVKDSSQIIPGHGGLLDRLDGFVFAVALATAIGLVRGGGDGVGRGLMVW